MSRPAVGIVTFVVGLVLGTVLTAAAGPAGPAEVREPGVVTGIGGVFFKAEDPDALRAWYGEHLGIEATAQGANFMWRERDDPHRLARTVWSVFPEGTDYFGGSDQDFMVNYRVDDMDALLDRLGEAGVEQVGETERYDFGSFAWIVDGEGNRVELWEPAGEPTEGP